MKRKYIFSLFLLSLAFIMLPVFIFKEEIENEIPEISVYTFNCWVLEAGAIALLLVLLAGVVFYSFKFLERVIKKYLCK